MSKPSQLPYIEKPCCSRILESSTSLTPQQRQNLGNGMLVICVLSVDTNLPSSAVSTVSPADSAASGTAARFADRSSWYIDVGALKQAFGSPDAIGTIWMYCLVAALFYVLYPRLAARIVQACDFATKHGGCWRGYLAARKASMKQHQVSSRAVTASPRAQDDAR